MKIEDSNRRELTPEEQQELEKFKVIIQGAIADGILTRYERDRIAYIMRADGKITYEKFELLRTLMHEKIASGELRLDYS
ncbi:MAG: hypothetical protein MUD14_26295 [Hydrococcus sp. Prado102]|jgi:hypothetical protein|nr:hypothetical protein [Hydrococcus sp. Prado102]